MNDKLDKLKTMNEITGRKAEGLSLANFMLYLYILCIILNFMHNFENFAKVKFRDILLTGTGHRDRRLNRDCPGQTGTYGRSSYSSMIGVGFKSLCYIA